MRLNQAIDHFNDAVHYVGKYYTGIPDATLYLPFNLLLIRQGDQVEKAYPETISHAKYLFGARRIDQLLKMPEGGVHMDRQLRMDIEGVFKVVAFELNYLLSNAMKVEDKMPCVNEMSRLIMAFKDTFSGMHMRQVDASLAINYLRECQNVYLEERLTCFTK